MGGHVPITDDTTDERFLEDEDDQIEADHDLECPLIIVPKEEKTCLRQPWRTTLIVKLLGRNICYTTLLSKRLLLWKPKVAFDLIAL